MNGRPCSRCDGTNLYGACEECDGSGRVADLFATYWRNKHSGKVWCVTTDHLQGGEVTLTLQPEPVTDRLPVETLLRNFEQMDSPQLEGTERT